MTLYVFDTSSWARIGRTHPQDIFVSLWDRLIQSVANGELCSPEEVLHELEQGTDNLAAQLSEWDGLFVALDDSLQMAVSEIMEQLPTLADPDSERNRADPFVVALARLRGGVVVTEEKRRRSATGPLKIPDACDILGVRNLDWFGFLRERAWRL